MESEDCCARWAPEVGLFATTRLARSEDGVTVPHVEEKIGFLGPLLRVLKRRIGRGMQRWGDGSKDDVAAGDMEEQGGGHPTKSGHPEDILDRSLAQKVLHGWLQNRHQLLVPLTFRLGRLEPDDTDLLMRFTAVALLNGSRDDEASRRPVERWLKSIGADDGAVATFQSALRGPAPLNSLLETIRKRDLAAYAYAAAVAAVDGQEASGRLFANFVAARLALSADAVRSIDRRYRR